MAEELEVVFSNWKAGVLLKQPRGELKQTHLMHLYKQARDGAEKRRLLDLLISRTVTVEQFQAMCGKQK